VLRLLRGLLKDPEIPRSVRLRVWIAIVYNIQPLNVIPDFIPVIGLADNVIITAWALRSAVHKAGSRAVLRSWSGTHEQAILLARLTGLTLKFDPAMDDIGYQSR
jgi:uncharacterized membrane protein YkvA (DUF1232 family)